MRPAVVNLPASRYSKRTAQRSNEIEHGVERGLGTVGHGIKVRAGAVAKTAGKAASWVRSLF